MGAHDKPNSWRTAHPSIGSDPRTIVHPAVRCPRSVTPERPPPAQTGQRITDHAAIPAYTPPTRSGPPRTQNRHRPIRHRQPATDLVTHPSELGRERRTTCCGCCTDMSLGLRGLGLLPTSLPGPGFLFLGIASCSPWWRRFWFGRAPANPPAARPDVWLRGGAKQRRHRRDRTCLVPG